MKHVDQVGGTHYQAGDKPQHWDLVIMYDWDYFQAQITKYLMRWKSKGATPEMKLQDLKKARSFLDKYIAEHEAFLPAPPPTIPVGTVLGDREAHGTVYLSDEYFQSEGGYGTGQNLYKCRACGVLVTAASLSDAALRHGSCPGKGYVAQG